MRGYARVWIERPVATAFHEFRVCIRLAAVSFGPNMHALPSLESRPQRAWTMDISKIRLANLEVHIKHYETAKEFCEVADISQSHLSQLRAGTKNLGSQLARKIEGRLKLQEFALDQNSVPALQLTLEVTQKMSLMDALGSLPLATFDAVSKLIYTLAAEAKTGQLQHTPSKAPPPEESVL